MLAMGGHLLPQVGLMVGLVLVGVCVCGARASETPPTMTLDEIGKALDREPASLSVDSFDRRARILEQLDQHLSVADSELSREVITYYRQRIDWALDQIESTEVTDSLILWKLYSSSVVIKTPGAIVGVDLCEGPNDDMYGRQQVPFCLTEAQRERLAALIGYSFHTHHHYDHLSHALVRDMAARGTPVFVTSQHRELWQDEPFAPLLHELEPEEVMRLFRGRPGIGVKTISVVLLFCCGRDIFPVDTHVNRLCNRLGLVKPGSSPEKTFEQMKPLVPKSNSLSLHVNLIRLGRALCRAQKPSCDECPIRERCEFGSGAGASKLS